MIIDQKRIEKVHCPQCTSPTKLLWVCRQSRGTIPLCKTCFYTLQKRGSKKSSNYEVYFLPIILNPEPKVWEISSEKQYGFRDLKLFIDHCLDPNNADSEKDNFIIKDKASLLRLVDSLFDLIPNIHPLSFETFKKQHELKIPINMPKQEQQFLVQKWEAQINVQYKVYLRVFREAHQREQDTVEIRRRIASRLRNEIQNRYDRYYLIQAQKVSWKMLPSGRHPFAEILRHIKSLHNYYQDVRYDEERLEKIYSLVPTSTYIGTDEFKGYIAFYFDELQIAVLDCHIVGNAIYVMDGDWQALSKLSKSALLENHQGKVRRIIHTGEWFRRLRSFLYVRGWRPKQ